MRIFYDLSPILLTFQRIMIIAYAFQRRLCILSLSVALTHTHYTTHDIHTFKLHAAGNCSN